ncbi:uncharacterized protein LOC121876535 [Homarus americanus]|uniref:uncharacterized protein LOC121876535 n=1 Tax=Homarus americanus TaxID=6706 RepID=UPI001C45A075|nr:uncharacterized protein LOC121876535 [Homarus americanus]XP_042237657.1 uncharacterized protein LOC121876535 [Homarus americanus]
MSTVADGPPATLTLLLLVLSLFLTQAQLDVIGGEEDTYPAVYLQSQGVSNNKSFVQWKKSVPTLSTLTVCLHLYLLHTRSNLMPLLSYSVPEFPDELLVYVNWDTGAVVVVCCGGDGHVELEGVFTFSILHTWVHICLALDLQAWRYTLMVDSKGYSGEVITLSGEELIMQGGGILLLGQEQDLHGEGFNLEQSLEAYIANFLIYPQFLREQLINEFVSCDFRRFDTATVSFVLMTEDWQASGDVELFFVPKQEVCGEPPKTHVMFPEHRTLYQSQVLCQMLKGMVAVPESEAENRQVVEDTKSLVATCTTGYGVYLWLGIGVSRGDDTWEYINLETNATIQYNNFRHGYARSISTFRCVFMDSLAEGKWVVYPCNIKTCTVCTFTSHTTLRLRGLCGDTLLNRQFIINGMKNNKALFDGISHTQIYWDNTTWVMRDLFFSKITATMEMTNIMQYPLGLQRWNITGDSCPTTQPELLLTACRADQYTCNDGTCILKMQRCDLEVNCPDQSDERLCNAVVVPRDYIKEVPPARVGTEPARIHINVTILSMQPIDTRNMKLTFDLSLDLIWRDPRLDMESLNYAETLNVIHDEENIWRPEIIFQDVTGTEAETKLQWETFVAVMQSGPDPDDITRVREDEVYPGDKNSLKLTQTYHVIVSCQMNLVSYPFDSQLCSFIIRLQYFTKDLVAFKGSDILVEYRGAKNLREYEMRHVEMVQSDWNSHSGQEIRFRLENLSGFYVSSTYVPTFLMVLICYSTFYFELDDFNDRIMVSLTALLVLATLFTQITETTPKTSYLKLLDTWFVACILINFSIVILLVIINYQKMRESSNLVMPFSKKKVMYPPPERSRKTNLFSQIVVPIILLILVIAYVGVSVNEM